jgi:CheY-like chemotaxis protein
VLLVDADPRSARVFEVSLRNAGYSVTHVQSAVEAIEAIEVAIPDLVISDTRLAPSKGADAASALSDGYSLCRRLKDDPVWYAVPFIFLTSSASIEDKIRGLELGVEDFLTKPIYLREIITRIQLVLAKKQREGMEGRTSRASFTGLLSEMGLVDLLSTIDLGRKSGVLELEAPQGRGVVFFRDGRVVDARANKVVAANAVYRMLLWTDGRFEIRFGPCTANEVIEMSTQGLLMEGMRRIDEWQRMREQLPPLDLVFEVDVPEVLARIGEIPDEINPILRAFDGRRTLMEVVDESGIDDLEALATLTKLYFEGLIVAGKAPDGTASDARVAAVEDRKRDTLIGFDTDVESSIPSPPVDVAEDHLLLPASTPGDGVPVAASNDEGNTTVGALTSAPSSPVVPDGTGAAILPDPQSARTDSSATTSQEPAVAKQRGKNRRSKREFADSSSPATNSSSPLATTSTAPVVDRDDSEEEESSVPAADSVAATPAVEPAKPAASDTSGSQRALSDVASSAEKAAEVKVEATSEAAVATTEAKSEPAAAAESSTANTDAAKADEAKGEGGTVIQFPRATRGADDEKKAEEPKAEEPKAEDKKPEPAPAVEAKKSEPPPAVEAKKADAKKADEKKADAKKPDEKKADKKPEGAKRERKDSHGDLGDEAKEFFSDKSYEVAYKKTHDTFEDLEPEVAADAPQNKKLMYATVALLVAIVGIVGGFAVYRKFFGVDDATLPTTGSLLANNNSATTTGNTSQTTANSTGNSGSTGSGPSTTGAGEADASSATAANTTTTVEEDASSAATTTAVEDSGVQTAANTTAEQDSGAQTAANTTAVEDSGVATASNSTTTPAVVDSGVAPAAPSGPAELLVAAQRAQNRGAATAATAYQAYLDAGGNDGAAIARFAFWLANRGDLGRAAEWSDRATQLDANNQLAWYVLGASKMEGPRRDPAGARAAFRRCAQLPGRYASECRSAL